MYPLGPRGPLEPGGPVLPGIPGAPSAPLMPLTPWSPGGPGGGFMSSILIMYVPLSCLILDSMVSTCWFICRRTALHESASGGAVVALDGSATAWGEHRHGEGGLEQSGEGGRRKGGRRKVEGGRWKVEGGRRKEDREEVLQLPMSLSSWFCSSPDILFSCVSCKVRCEHLRRRDGSVPERGALEISLLGLRPGPVGQRAACGGVEE